MNGLEYIRVYCNISQSFLAELIGVSRQSVYLWENERKNLPPKRRKQLSELFGLEEKFFGEIDEEMIRELYKKQSYLHSFNGKNYFCFIAHENAVYGGKRGVYLHNPNEIPSITEIPISLNEKLDICKRDIQNLLESIRILSERNDDKPMVHSHITSRTQIDRTFSGLVCTIEEIDKKPPEHKMVYWHTLWDTIVGISLANGAIDEEDLDKENDNPDDPWGTSASWIIGLAEYINRRNTNFCDSIKWLLKPKS